VDDLVNPAWRHPDVLGQALLADLHRAQELLAQHLTGMDRRKSRSHRRLSSVAR
jgi:hypothetical protein